MIRRLPLLLVALPMLAAAQGGSTVPSKPAPPPEIFLRSPANNTTVGTTFPVVFGLRNYGVAPAGVNVDGTGHFHVMVNAAAAPAPGSLIPKDSMNLHFGTGIIETTMTLKPGTYTLRVVLGDFEHKVISSALVSGPVRITVK